MRAITQGRHSRLAQQLQRDAEDAIATGVLRQSIEAVNADGTVAIDGRTLVNFGSCSYLGLWEHDALRKAALTGIERFGVSFSSSRLYASLPYYDELESRLGEIFDARAVATGTTTLGHLSALPAVVSGADAILIDRQAHASLHLATQVLSARQIPVHPVPHADADALEGAIQDLADDHHHIWYVGDGVYSMFGDIGPNSQVIDLLDRYPALHAYIDDAHGFAWTGSNGRGVVLGERSVHPRLVVAISLSKAFGAGGGAIISGSDELADQIAFRGGPLMFGGPIQTAELAAGVAAAELLLSPESVELHRRMRNQIDLVADRARAHGVPLSSWAHTPIWFAHVGGFEQARNVAKRVVDAGYWVNLSSFPVVPFGQAGIRFTNTLSQSDDQIDGLLGTLAKAIEAELGDAVVIDLTKLESAS